MQQFKKEIETLKLQLTAKDAQLATARQHNAAQATQLSAKDAQIAALAAEIQLLKSKATQQLSSSPTSSAAPTKAVVSPAQSVPTNTAVSTPKKGFFSSIVANKAVLLPFQSSSTTTTISSPAKGLFSFSFYFFSFFYIFLFVFIFLSFFFFLPFFFITFHRSVSP